MRAGVSSEKKHSFGSLIFGTHLFFVSLSIGTMLSTILLLPIAEAFAAGIGHNPECFRAASIVVYVLCIPKLNIKLRHFSMFVSVQSLMNE